MVNKFIEISPNLEIYPERAVKKAAQDFKFRFKNNKIILKNNEKNKIIALEFYNYLLSLVKNGV